MKLKKIIALTLALAMTAAMAGCSGKTTENADGAQAATTCDMSNMKPWQNGNLLGGVTKDTATDIKEDYYIYCNKDFLATAEIPEGQSSNSSFVEVALEVSDKTSKLLSGKLNEDHDSRQAQILYQNIADMDSRNEAGIEPLRPYINAIQDISSMQELNDYLTDPDSLTHLCTSGIDTDLLDSSKYSVYLESTTLLLSDADEYTSLTDSGKLKKEAYQELMQKMLLRLDYSQEDALNIVNRAFEFETELAGSMKGSEAQKQDDYLSSLYNPTDINQLDNISPVFPLKAYLKDYIDAGADEIIITEPQWLSKLNDVYTEDNMESIKAYLISHVLILTCDILDQENLDLFDAAKSKQYGTEYTTDIEDYSFNYVNTYLPWAASKLYVDQYVTPEFKETITAIINKVVEQYSENLKDIDWLSEETQAKAIEKIEKMKVRSVYPDDWSIYSVEGLELKTWEEGGSILDNIIAISDWDRNYDLKNKIGKNVDKTRWIMSPLTTNACYNPQDNSINILAGVLAGDIFNENMEAAQIYGSIGVIIGHEISHAFDSTGSQFDAEGNMADWWTEEDKANFNNRVQNVVDYFGTLEVLPDKFLDGQLTKTENVADLGGVNVMLQIAKNTENFDYDKFFTAYAKLWKNVTTYESIDSHRVSNVHSLEFIRVNAVVQQFQEFYDTYGITEGDNMYLAPENRVKVW